MSMRATQEVKVTTYRMMSALTVTFYLITIALLSSNILLTTQALATPSARRKAARKSSKKSSSGGGFAKKPAKYQPTIINPAAEQYDAAQDEAAKRAVSSLFSVCAHIQDPKLYMPKWADACRVQRQQQGGAVMANRNVARGQVLTLFPIHALGLRMLRQGKDDTEFVAYDQDADGELFTSDEKAGLRLKLNIPLDKSQPAYSILGNAKRHVLFSMFLPEKEAVPGWLGGRMRAASNQYAESNCITVPLPGAAPLCAVVATKDVSEGEEIVQTTQPLKPNEMDKLKEAVAREYRSELATLQMYIEAACEAVQPQSDNYSSAGQQLLLR